MKLRKKIREGCCSEIFQGEFKLMQKKFPCALKICCNKYRPLSFMYEPSDGIVKGGNSVSSVFSSGTNSILGGLVLEDGVFGACFAIVSTREWGDLRTLVDLRERVNSSSSNAVQDFRVHFCNPWATICSPLLSWRLRVQYYRLLSHPGLDCCIVNVEMLRLSHVTVVSLESEFLRELQEATGFLSARTRASSSGFLFIQRLHSFIEFHKVGVRSSSLGFEYFAYLVEVRMTSHGVEVLQCKQAAAYELESELESSCRALIDANRDGELLTQHLQLRNSRLRNSTVREGMI